MQLAPIPDWYSDPPGSRRRTPEDSGFRRQLLFETLSSQATVEEVLSFYEARTSQGGLVRSAEPSVGHAGPAFSAENSEYTFSVYLYRHTSLTFWTIQLTGKASPTFHRMQTIQQEAGVARYSPPREIETIPWVSLPEWAQFVFDIRERGEVRRHSSPAGNTWDASIVLHLPDGDHREIFATCLESLDRRGFDATGIDRLDHCYYVSILQWGHSLNAHVCSDGGDRGSLTIVNTLGHISGFLRYSGPKPVTES